MSDSNPLPQDAFRSVPLTDEDKYFLEREKETIEDLKDARAKAFEDERHCIRPECKNELMERVALDNIEIDRCPKCGGVWLDPGELELLVKRSKVSGNSLVRFFYHLAGRYDV